MSWLLGQPPSAAQTYVTRTFTHRGEEGAHLVEGLLDGLELLRRQRLRVNGVGPEHKQPRSQTHPLPSNIHAHTRAHIYTQT